MNIIKTISGYVGISFMVIGIFFLFCLPVTGTIGVFCVIDGWLGEKNWDIHESTPIAVLASLLQLTISISIMYFIRPF